MLNDFEIVNDILNQMADEDMLEPMVEPIDCADCHPMDWAEVAGIADDIFDEMYPNAEMMVDGDGNSWYVS